MGPLMVEGAYFAVSGEWSTTALVLSIPVGLLVAAILHGNEWRDIREDSAGRHLDDVGADRPALGALRLRGPGHRRVHGARQWRSSRRALPSWTLLAVLSLPFLAQVIRAAELGATGQARAIAMIDLQTARLHLAFGSLLVARTRPVAGGRWLTARAPARATRRRPRGRPPAPWSLGLLLAQGWFAATFRGPRDRFWHRMTMTGLDLGGLALLTSRPGAADADRAEGGGARTGVRGGAVRDVPRRRSSSRVGSCPAATPRSATSTRCGPSGRRRRSRPGWRPSSARRRSCSGAASSRRR